MLTSRHIVYAFSALLLLLLLPGCGEGSNSPEETPTDGDTSEQIDGEQEDCGTLSEPYLLNAQTHYYHFMNIGLDYTLRINTDLSYSANYQDKDRRGSDNPRFEGTLRPSEWDALRIALFTALQRYKNLPCGHIPDPGLGVCGDCDGCWDYSFTMADASGKVLNAYSMPPMYCGSDERTYRIAGAVNNIYGIVTSWLTAKIETSAIYRPLYGLCDELNTRCEEGLYCEDPQTYLVVRGDTFDDGMRQRCMKRCGKTQDCPEGSGCHLELSICLPAEFLRR